MSRPNPDAPLTRHPVVNAIGKIMRPEIDGAFARITRFRYITFPNGKADVYAIIVLAEIVYWHRPSKKLAEPECWAGGEQYNHTKRFKGNSWYCKLGEIARKYGLGKSTVSDALKRLESMGLIEKELTVQEDL